MSGMGISGSGASGTGLKAIVHQLSEGAAFGALIVLILWAPHLI
jgi:hypothetical protein